MDLEQGRGAGEGEGSGAGERSWEGSGRRGRGEEQGRTLRLRTSSFQAGGEELARRGGGRPAGRRASGGQELNLQGEREPNSSHGCILGLIRAISRANSRRAAAWARNHAGKLAPSTAAAKISAARARVRLRAA